MSGAGDDPGSEALVDQRYYQVVRPGTLAERIVVAARDGIYRSFIEQVRPTAASTILDVGVSDVVGEAANVLERLYPHQDRLTAVGLGAAHQFRSAFPLVAYQQIEAGAALPFEDGAFDIATSNAVLEHVGSHAAQLAFVAEMARVARTIFISVPHRYFPVEHHTGIPFLHWADGTFAVACKILRKGEWAQSTQLILMDRARLHALAAPFSRLRPTQIGTTGIRLGPCSSNLFLTIGTT